MARLICLISVLGILLWQGIVYAQDPNGISAPRIIPPNPVSQEFQKHLGYPVSGATGLVEISVPLYTLELPGINIPLALKYHSSGIKVEQSYGNLGYGWTMFPQFKITRTVMGKADEYYSTANIPQPPLSLPVLVDIATSADGTNNGSGGSTKDGEFDIFSVSLPNYEGNFILKKDASGFTAVSIPDSPLQITVTGNYLASFEIKDDKGIRYLFNDLSGNVPCTDWMLTQMILPGANNTITFQYVSGGNQAILLSNNTLVVWDEMIGCNAKGAIIGYGAMDYNTYAYQQSSTPSMGEPPVYNLRYIQFSNGNVEMNYGANGYGGFNELQNIKVYNTAQQVLKTITFTQSTDHQLLQKVAISGEGEYNFEYNPNRFQNPYNQDRWGYYNYPNVYGTVNSSMIPALTLNVRNYIVGANQIVTYPIQFGDAYLGTDTAAMKANSLEKIIYPTGGWSRFYYEPNSFFYNGSARFEGGLRIKKINTYDPVSGKTITKTYKYGNNESGLGNLIAYPEDDSFIDEGFIYAFADCDGPHAVRGRRRTINSHARYRYFNLSMPVWYDKVTEYSDGGKNMYEYNYTPDQVSLLYYNGSDNFSIGSPSTEHGVDILNVLNNLAMGGPSLYKKQVYKNENSTYTILQEEENIHTLASSQQVISGLIVRPMGYIYEGSVTNNSWLYTSPPYNQIGNGNPFMTAGYYIQTGINNLTSTIKRDYNNGTLAATTTTTNTYESYNLSTTQTTASDGAFVSQNFYYPTSTSIPDLTASQQQIVNTLRDNNRLTALIQKTSFKGSVPLEGVLYQYKDWGNNIFEPELLYTKTTSNPYELRLRYAGYDVKGNPISVSKENDHPISYIYGYQQTYPVIKAENTDSETLSANVGQALIDVGFVNGISDLDIFLTSLGNLTTAAQKTTLRSFISKVQENFSSSNALVSTYTYDPLIGMTSITDANETTIYYEYDSFGRLSAVKDNDDNILKTYTYHYKQ